MRAFFKMQIKTYFRMLSTHLTPLIIGIFYIGVVASIKATMKPADAKNLLDSYAYVETSASIAMFGSFMMSAFVTQTFFYKYKQEGVDYILFSKPISRTQTYFANIFACLIGLIYSVALLTIEFFISQLLIPIDYEIAVISSLTHFGAALLCCIFSLGIGSVIHTFIEAKVYQVIVAIIPSLGISSFAFVKGPQQKETLVPVYQSVKSFPFLIANSPSDESGSIKAVGNISNKVKHSTEWLVASESLASRFENKYELNFNSLDKDIKHKNRMSIVDGIEKAKQATYSKTYWLNYREYFYPLYTAYDRKYESLSLFVDYNNNLNMDASKENRKYYKIFENGKLVEETNNKLKEKYDLDMSKYIVIETRDKDNNLKYYALGIDIENFEYIFDLEKFFDTSTFTLKYYNIQNTSLDKFSEFNEKIIDPIVGDKTFEKLGGVSASTLVQRYIGTDKIFKDDEAIDSIALFKLIHYISKLTGAKLLDDEIQFDKVKAEFLKEAEQYNDEETQIGRVFKQLKEWANFKDPILNKLCDFINKTLAPEMITETEGKTDIQVNKINLFKESLLRRMKISFAQSFWTIQLLREFDINKNSKHYIDSSRIKDYLSKNTDNFASYMRDYKNSSLNLVPLDNNLIEMKRTSPITSVAGPHYTLLFFVITVTAGWYIFKKRNFS